MYNDIIKLLNFEGFNISFKSIKTAQIDGIIYCYVTLEKNKQTCPICGGNNLIIKDYRTKKLKHSISTCKPCFIIYKARRYKCKCCNKVFYENNSFALKNNKCSVYTTFIVLETLRSHTVTFTDVAKQYNLSTTSIMNIFDQYVVCRRTPLPRILCFDEVYTSRKSYQKYAFVMVDFQKNKIVDVYQSRHLNRLSQNISNITQAEREKVEYIIIDMWDSYRTIGQLYFKNAKIAVDSFHVIQHLNEAMIKIRLRIMRKYDKKTKSLQANDMYYYMLKRFHYFFVKNYEDIFNGPIKILKMRTKWTKDEIRRYLLSIDNELKEAYYLKEKYREFNLTSDYNNCNEEFDELIEKFRNSHLEEFHEFGRILAKWKPYIKNSLIRINGRRLSNGTIEGINSRIKTIMKGANGYQNFERLRNRIIYSINKDTPIQGTPIK